MNCLRKLSLVVVTVAVLGTAACGIPSDDSPRAIPEAAVPQEAREPRGQTPGTTVPPGTAQVETIYLVGGSETEPRLQPVNVSVPGPVDPAQRARRVIEQLVSTRPEDVNMDGVVTNQLPSNVTVLDATLQTDGVLDLNLSELGVQGQRLRLAMAQIVFTATELPNVTSVRVAFDGQPLAVPTDSGSVSAGTAVSRSDYSGLDPGVPRPAE
jgi:hypothetical protein